MNGRVPRAILDAIDRVAASRRVGVYHVQLDGVLLRVLLEAENGITHANCSDFARALRDEIDTRVLLPDGYRLEISSPGIERRLCRPSHFAGAVGARVRMRIAAGAFNAVIIAADESAVTLGCIDEVEGTTRRVHFSDISSAHVKVSDSELLARAGRGREEPAGWNGRSGPGDELE